MKTTARRKAYRSLRTILIVWFLLFSFVPLAFVTGYSVIKYEKAIDNELSERLSGNAREISVILNDFKMGLVQKRDHYIKDNGLIYHLSKGDAAAIRAAGSSWLKSDFASSLSFFNRDGRMLVSIFKDEKGEARDFFPQSKKAIYLSDANLEKLKLLNEFAFVEFSSNQKVSLIFISKVKGAGGRLLGYLEQLVDIDQIFLSRLKQRMKLEMALIQPTGQVAVATHPDFYVYKNSFFQEYIKTDRKSFFELNIRGNPYGLIVYPVEWGQSQIYLALGASKVEAKAVLRNVNYAFYSVVGAVISLLIITIFMTSKVQFPYRSLLGSRQARRSNSRSRWLQPNH